jgi:hypothetical protein
LQRIDIESKHTLGTTIWDNDSIMLIQFRHRSPRVSRGSDGRRPQRCYSSSSRTKMSLARGSTSLLLRNRQRLSCFHDNGTVTHRIDLSTISISQYAIRNMPSSLSLSRQYDRCSSPVYLDLLRYYDSYANEPQKAALCRPSDLMLESKPAVGVLTRESFSQFLSDTDHDFP